MHFLRAIPQTIFPGLKPAAPSIRNRVGGGAMLEEKAFIQDECFRIFSIYISCLKKCGSGELTLFRFFCYHARMIDLPSSAILKLAVQTGAGSATVPVASFGVSPDASAHSHLRANGQVAACPPTCPPQPEGQRWVPPDGQLTQSHPLFPGYPKPSQGMAVEKFD